MRKRISWGAFSLSLLFLTGCSGPGAVKPYPLDVCLVTDNALGSMGDPVAIVYEGREIKFCCSPCLKKFYADPEKYLEKLGKQK